MNLKIFCDGGSRGNPGPAACAFVVYEQIDPSTRFARSGLPALKLRAKRGKYLGVVTNNEAEYQAVFLALSYLSNLSDLSHLSHLSFFLDSLLVVNQLNGLWKIKEPRLRELLLKVRQLENGRKISYTHIPRSQNSAADFLVNEVLDKSLKIVNCKL